MVQRRAVPGYIAASFQRKGITVQTNGTRRISSAMVGVSHGPTTAASSTTGLQRARTGNLGASEKSSFGGTKGRSNGRGSTIPITRRRPHPTNLPMFMKAAVWKRLAGQGPSLYILMEWAGYGSRAA